MVGHKFGFILEYIFLSTKFINIFSYSEFSLIQIYTFASYFSSGFHAIYKEPP